MSYGRVLSFQHKRTGDVVIHRKIKEIRKSNKIELDLYRAKKLSSSTNEKSASAPSTISLWSKIRKRLRKTASLHGFINLNNEIIENTEDMLELVTTHYGKLFSEQLIYRPHSFVDSSEMPWDNVEEPIPPITMSELMKTVSKVKKKQSTDAHGISPFMLQYISRNYFIPLLKIFNDSLRTYSGSPYWEHVKMKLLAKKDSIYLVKDTRPISLLDIFLKVLEKLFLERF